MIGHEFESGLRVEQVQGQAYVVSEDARIVPVAPGMQIAPSQVLLTNQNSAVVVSKDGERFVVDSQCASCLVPVGDNDYAFDTANLGVAFNPDALDSDAAVNLDVAELQRLIANGEDPTAIFEAAAAGENAGSSNAGFIVVDYGYNATLTEAGFDTLGPLNERDDEIDFLGGRVGAGALEAPDVDAVGGQDAVLAVDEGDLDKTPYGTPEETTFAIAAGSERLLPGSLQIAPDALAQLESELTQIKSGGDDVEFTRQTSVNAAGVGTFTLTGTVNGEVVVELVIAATQNGDSLDVTASLTQFGPLDHTSGGGDYIQINGERITIDVPIQVADTGGDLMQSPATVTLTSYDGASPVVGDATVPTLEEKLSQEVEASTSQGIDRGSDTIASISFDPDATAQAFAGITSHGYPTTVDTSVPGVVTLYSEFNGEPVLQISLQPSADPSNPSSYHISQFQPIDQNSDGDDDQDLTQIVLPFTVTDADGDVSNSANVTFNLQDGAVAEGGERLDDQGEPLDLVSLREVETPTDETLENSQTGSVTIDAKTDRLLPESLIIQTEFDGFDLISELKSLTNNDKQPIDEVTVAPSTDADGNLVYTLTGLIEGEPAIQMVLVASQSANGLDVELDVTLRQFQPLNHPINPSDADATGLVTADGERIRIKVPVQVQDSDGDYLTDGAGDTPRLLTFDIIDDDSTTFGLGLTEAVRVNESSLDGGANPGSMASGVLNIDSLDDDGNPLTLDSEKLVGDNVTDFAFVTDYVTFPNGQPVTASGYDVFLEARDDGDASTYKTYFAIADDGTGENRDVFKVILNQDGSFTFELLSAVDHDAGEGNNELIFNLLAYAIDADGDESGIINVPIIVTDDIPYTQGELTLALTDSATETVSASVDVFDLVNPDTVPSGVEDLRGADGTTFISAIFNGVEWVDISSTRPSSTNIFSEDDPSLTLGVISIDPNTDPVGELTFTLAPNLDNPSEVFTQNIKYQVSDFDGDTAEGEIALTITDQTPRLTVAPSTDNGVFVGAEDQGQIDTDTEDQGVVGENGIPITLSLNVGDNDLGEAYEDGGQLVLNGDVTLIPLGDAMDVGGTFYFNGTPIVPDGDGNIDLSSDMFTVEDENAIPLIFNLTGVTFVPAPDFAADSDTDFIAFSVEAEINGHAPVTAEEPMKILVEGVADVPALSLIGEAEDGVFELKEDFDPFNTPVNDPSQFVLGDLISADLQDIDGSESLRLEFTLTPDQGTLRGGFVSQNSDGVWVLEDPSQLGKVRFIPTDDFSGDIELKVTAIATESDPALVKEAQNEVTLTLRVEPQADDARLSVTRVFDNEDAGNPDPDLAEGEAISLAGKISLTSLGTDTDGSETLFIRIYDIPDGATLQRRDGASITTLTDADRISVDDISKLELIPPVHSNENVTLMVEGIVVDSAENSAPDERIIASQPLEIILKGVADTPEFSVENPGTEAGQWQVDADSGMVSTRVPEDGINGDGLVAIDFNVISGEKALAPDDSSETLSMIIIDPPEGVGLVVKNDDGSLSDVELAFAGWQTDSSGMSVPSYAVDLSAIASGDVFITLPPHTTQDLQIQTRLIATENDGDSKAIDTVVAVNIDPPVIDAADTYQGESFGLEDTWNQLDWQPDLTIVDAVDSEAQGVVEKVVGATISGFADTDVVRLNNGSDMIDLTPVGGEITLTEAQIEAGYQVEYKREAHSDLDLTLTTSVTVRQDDFENVTQAEKVINGIIEVDIQAKVETEEGELQLVDEFGAPATEFTTDSEGQIQFSNAVRFIHPDTSSTEEIVRIVITDLADGFYVNGAQYDGQNGWVVDDANNFSIVAPPNNPDPAQTTFTVSAMVIDYGDAGEGDESDLAAVSSQTITLNYQNTQVVNQDAHDVAVPTDPVVVEGDEDNPISLEALGEAIKYPSEATGDFVFDQVTVVINGSDIPKGTVIGGVRYHIDNDTYVFEVPNRNDEGNPYPDGLDLSGLTITAPEDFAGELIVPLTIVSVDSKSGDTATSDVSVQLNVKPLVDIPPPIGEAQPSDLTAEFSFAFGINGTGGLDENRQPISPDDFTTEEVTYPGEALEDGIISLNLTASLADIDSANGEEAISAAVLTVDPAFGVFLRPDGTETATLTASEAELGDIRFKPAEDFSGTVPVEAQLTISDTATTGTDSRDVSASLSFEVTPVNDDITFTQDGADLAESDVVALEAVEDNAISLADIGGYFDDIDGSESLASVTVSNVPSGFTLSAPAINSGGGVWVIPASAISDLSSLSQISINPPKDFSGDVALSLTIYTKEDGLSFIAGESQAVAVTFAPQGDGATAFVESVVSGDEDSEIDIDASISVKDDRDSLTAPQLSDVSVTENAAETLLITIAGVPDGGKILLPDGVAGSVSPETSDGGDVVVTVDSTQLDGLTFLPPQDANGQFVLDLAIQTVDNGDVSADVVNKQVTVNVKAVNDEPVNILADSYTTDEDVPLTITDLAVEDVDVRDGNGNVYVELAVGDGNMLSLVGENLDISITGEGTNVLMLEGGIDAINTLLAQGVTYQFGGENSSGEDTLTMTTRDRGNFGAGGQKFDRDSVSIVVAPKSDLPELSIAPQLASIRAATGALVPLLGLMATLVDPVENEFTLTFAGLGGAAELVDSQGDPVGADNGDGSWTLSQADLQTMTLADLNLRFNAQPVGDLVVTARSDVGDGEPKETSLSIAVKVVDTDATPVLNDSDNSGDNLVVDGGNNTQLVGGLGADILIGGEGDDEAWGGVMGSSGDGEADTFAWQQGDFGSAGAPATDTIKDFEPGIDVIDLSDAFNTNGIFTFTDLANRMDIQTVGSDTRIQVFDDSGAAVQNIVVEGQTLNALLGMDASSLTQDEVLESMLMAGQLVVFDPTKTQFGTEADDVLEASGDDGEQLFGGDGDDILTGGAGDDILLGGAGDDTLTGGAGDDVFAWNASDVEAGTLARDVVTDFEAGDSVTGDKLDISALLPDTVGSASTVEELLDYIRPEVTGEGLTLHVSQTKGGAVVQDVVMQDFDLADLGLGSGATGTQILDELMQQQALKLD